MLDLDSGGIRYAHIGNDIRQSTPAHVVIGL